MITKLAILSFAHLHAHSYASCINALPDVALSAIWDDDTKRGKDAAKQYETKFEKDLDDLMLSDVDGVIVCAENAHHRKLVERAAQAGKWILCEKPLAPKTEDARAMVIACQKAGVGLGIAFPCRYVQSLIEARNRIRAGEFGTIYAASCTNHGMYPGGWFSEPKLSGGGGTMDHTVHVVDVLRWILDEEFVDVYAEIGNQFHKKEFKCDDLGSLHLTTESGIQVSHIASWSRPNSFPTWGDVTIEFIGSKGVLNVDAFNQKLNVYSDPVGKGVWNFWGSNADMALVRDFVEATAARRTPAIPGEAGVQATAVTVAAYESAQKGKRVEV